MAVKRENAYIGQQIQLEVTFRNSVSWSPVDPNNISKVLIKDWDELLEEITAITRVEQWVYRIITSDIWNTISRTITDTWYFTQSEWGSEEMFLMNTIISSIQPWISVHWWMTKKEIYDEACEDIDDELKLTRFNRYLNEWYFIILNKLYSVNPNAYRKTHILNLDSEIAEYDLPTDLQSIDKITYSWKWIYLWFPNQEIKIPKTTYDEDNVCWLRWVDIWGKILFRSLTQDLENVTIHYLRKAEALLEDSDVPEFNPNFHNILTYYIKSRYYQNEKMEMDWADFLRDFYWLLDELEKSVRPVKEKKRLKISRRF